MYKKLAAKVLDLAKKNGATEAEVDLGKTEGYSVNVRFGEVETIEHHHDVGLSVEVYFGQQKGVASTTDLSDESLELTVKKACQIARLTASDEASGLPNKSKLATRVKQLDLYYPWDLPVDDAIEMARECERLALSYDKRISNSEGAAISTGSSNHVLANSHGFIEELKTTRHGLHCTLVAEENEEMQREGSYSSARDFEDLWNIETIAQDAAKRTVKKLGSRRLPTCRVPVVFAADVATGLFSSFLSAISGGALYTKSSFLLDKVGKKIFPDFVQISENPFVAKAFGSRPFDAEGVAVKERALIENGILQGYLLSSYSARKLNMQTTGNAGGAHKLFVSHNDSSLEKLLQQMGAGLLVMDVIGQGVNLVTGDYSRGASGFWVENGEIQFPVEEITIASNLKDMFLGIAAIGSDVETRGSIHTGSILIDQMMVAGA